jgi:MutS domain V
MMNLYNVERIKNLGLFSYTSFLYIIDTMQLHQLWQQIEQRKKIDEDLDYSIDCWKQLQEKESVDHSFYQTHIPTMKEHFEIIPQSIFSSTKDKEKDPWFHELEIVEAHHDLGMQSISHTRQHVAETLFHRLSQSCKTSIGKQWIYHYLLHPTHHLETLKHRRTTLEWFRASPTLSFAMQEKNIPSIERNLTWFFQELKPEIQVLLTKIYLQWDWFSSISHWLNTSILFHRGMHAFKMFVNPGMQIVLPLLIFIGFMFGSIWMVQRTGFTTTMRFWYQMFSYMWTSSTSNRSKITLLLTVGVYIFSFFYNIYQSIKETLFIQSIFEQLYQSITPILSLIELCNQMIKEIPREYIPTSLHESLEKALPILLSCVHPTLFTSIHQDQKGFFKKWFMYPRSEIAVSFYTLYQQKEHLIPCLSFLGWLDAHTHLANFMKEESPSITWANYVQTQGTPYIRSKGIYYPLLCSSSVPNPVRIDSKFAAHRIITGPNAAGKSTYLKSIGLNQHLAQTFGFVFAKDYTCCLFEQFHSQLQLQDLKGAYSLFEAEMLRCQIFMERIQSQPKKLSLCLFDELFSSTNAHEGFAAAFAFVEYCIQLPHISFLLTTHYGLLQSLGRKYPKQLKLIRFDITRDPHTGAIQYPYKMKKGSSKQHIALELLSCQPTSKEWIDRAKDILVVLQKLEQKQCAQITKWIMNPTITKE